MTEGACLHSLDFVPIISCFFLFWLKAFPTLAVLWICTILHRLTFGVCVVQLVMSYQDVMESWGVRPRWQSGSLRVVLRRSSHLWFPSCSLFPCLQWCEQPSPLFPAAVYWASLRCRPLRGRLKLMATIFDPFNFYQTLGYKGSKGAKPFCMHLNILPLWSLMSMSSLPGELNGCG